MKNLVFVLISLLSATPSFAKDVYAEIKSVMSTAHGVPVHDVQAVSEVYSHLQSNARYIKVADYFVEMKNNTCYRITYALAPDGYRGFVVSETKQLCYSR